VDIFVGKAVRVDDEDIGPAPVFVELPAVVAGHDADSRRWLGKDAPPVILFRQCYHRLLDTIMSVLEQSDVLLTGSGGVGKTQLQALLLKRLLQRGHNVVVDLEDGQFAYATPDGKVRTAQRPGGEPVIFRVDDVNVLADPKTVYLYDARANPDNIKTTLPPLKVQGKSVISASPTRGCDDIKAFKRSQNIGGAMRNVYVKPWALQELLWLVQPRPNGSPPVYAGVKPGDVETLYNLYGGNVRHTVVRLVPRSAASSSSPVKVRFSSYRSLSLSLNRFCHADGVLRCR
jgi:hypothetical protein